MNENDVGGGGHGGASGRWLVSYADFITLLMVVFMVLYSMARVDSAKFSKLKASLASSSIGGGPLTPLPVGGNPINTAPTVTGSDPESYPGAAESPVRSLISPAPAPPAVIPATPPATEPPPAEATVAAEPLPEPDPEPEPQPPPPDPMTGLRESFLATNSARAGALTVSLQDRGLVISILTSVLFAEGQAELKQEATLILDEITEKLHTTSKSVLVEGAPDAASTKEPWDLASRRASAVVGYLVRTHGLAPSRFAVIGYGKGAGVDGIVNVVVLRRGQ